MAGPIERLLGHADDAARELGIGIDKVLRSWIIHQRNTATVRSSLEVRTEASLQIESLFRANPEADLDLRNVERFGLKNCQADRAFARHQWKRLRLTYQQGAPDVVGGE
jgi:transposase-like protein